MWTRVGASALAMLAVAGPAEAQAVSGRASLSAGTSYSTTLTDAWYPTPMTMAGPSLSLSPSGTLLYDTPLTTNTFTASGSVVLMFTKDLPVKVGRVGYSTRADYAGHFTLSERASTTASLGLTLTPLSGIGGSVESAGAEVTAIPTETAYMLTLNGAQTFAYDLTESLSFNQGASLNSTIPIDPTSLRAFSLMPQVNLGINRRFNEDTVGFTVTGSANSFSNAELGGVVSPAHVDIADGATFSWNRNWTETFSTALSLGVTHTVSPSQETPPTVQPTGAVNLNYRFGVIAVSLSTTYQAMPNLATSTTSFSNANTLRISIPIGETGLGVSGTGGYTHQFPPGGGAGHTHVATGDVSLSWHPSFASTLGASLRTAINRQLLTTDPLNAFTRLSLSLSLSYSYPDAQAAQVPVQFPPALGQMPMRPSGAKNPDRFEP